MKLSGSEIREKRKKKGLTQAKLAKKIGIGRSYLSQIENHYTTINPPEDLIDKLAEALGVDSKRLYQKIQTDRFLLREGGIGKAENLDLLTFTCFSSQIQKAEKSIKIYSFSSLPSLDILKDELVNALHRDVAIQIVLAEPTLENIYKRTLRPELTVQDAFLNDGEKVKDLDDFIFLLRHQQLRLETALSILKIIWQNKSNGVLNLHLCRLYTPKHFFIFDNKLCIGQEPSGEIEVIQRDNESDVFEKIATEFTEEWNGGAPFHWNDYYRAIPSFFTKETVKKFLTSKNLL